MLLSHHHIVYRQGETCAGAYCIEQGHVKLTRLNRDGEAGTVVVLKAGDWFGALASDLATCAETAVTKGVVRLRLLVGGTRRDAADADSIIASMARRQRFLERRLEAILLLDVRARLGAVLLNLATHHGQRCVHGHEVDVRLTHQELAELSGVSRPVVTATLNQWRRDKLVHYTREFICLDRREALQALLR